MQPAGRKDWYHGPSDYHAVWAVVAVLVSLVFHAGVVTYFPAIPVGRIPDLPEKRVSESLRVETVRRDPVSVPDRPASFRPENPSQQVDVSLEAESFAEALDPSVRDALEASMIPLQGASEALEKPDIQPPLSSWDARQALISIDQKRVPDAFAETRRVIPAIPRSISLDDVALPVLLSERNVQPVKAAPFAEIVPASNESADESVARRLSEQEFIPAIRDRITSLDEKPRQVTTVEPVEELLEIALYTYTSPWEPESLYFRIQVQPTDRQSIEPLPRDVLLIQDCSESMSQAKLDKCKVGLKHFIDSLGEEDRYDIMGFRETPYRCFDRWAEHTASHRATAEWFIESMESRGNTDILASLTGLLDLPREMGRAVVTVWVTDGRPTMGMMNHSKIIQTFTEMNRGNISVYAVGGGKKVNSFLLDLLSYQNRGDSIIVKDEENLPQALAQLGSRLRRPVLADLRYRFTGLREKEIYPKKLTHLFLDRPLNIYGKTSETGEAAFQIVGQAGPQFKDMVFSLDWNQALPGDASIRREWAEHKVYDLIGQHIAGEDEYMLRKIRSLIKQYSLDIPYGRLLPLW